MTQPELAGIIGEFCCKNDVRNINVSALAELLAGKIPKPQASSPERESYYSCCDTAYKQGIPCPIHGKPQASPDGCECNTSKYGFHECRSLNPPICYNCGKPILGKENTTSDVKYDPTLTCQPDYPNNEGRYFPKPEHKGIEELEPLLNVTDRGCIMILRNKLNELVKAVNEMRGR